MSGQPAPDAPDTPDTPVYGSGAAPRQTPPGTDGQEGLTRVTRLHHLAELKAAGEPWPMLTAYDFVSARLFQEAGIPVLLVGDSAANVVYGYDTTVPVTEDEMIPLVRAVTRGAPKALVVADLVFGSYEASDEQAVRSSTEILHRSGAHCVKLDEAGIRLFGRTRTGVAHCPCSNMRLASGIAPVRAMRDAGFEVNVWTVNDVEQARELASWGVTGIFTDRPQDFPAEALKA